MHNIYGAWLLVGILFGEKRTCLEYHVMSSLCIKQCQSDRKT